MNQWRNFLYLHEETEEFIFFFSQFSSAEAYNSNSCMEDPEINTLNLDVTAMMAYVSNMTNGHCNYVFKENVLTQQCQWEAERPVKPILMRLFEGTG